MQVFKNNVSLEATPASDTHIVNKAYLEDRISKINIQHAIKVDELPTCVDNGDGTYTISYVKDGTTKTTTDTSQWFYYVDVNGNLKQTIFLDGEELTIDGASVDFDDIENNLKSNYKKIIDGVYIQYSGKHRVLNVDTTYSNLKNISLDNNDRPIITTSTSIIRYVKKGDYVTIAYLQVNKDGTLDAKKYDVYNGATGASAFAETDIVFGNISYITN